MTTNERIRDAAIAAARRSVEQGMGHVLEQDRAEFEKTFGAGFNVASWVASLDPWQVDLDAVACDLDHPMTEAEDAAFCREWRREVSRLLEGVQTVEFV